MQHGVFIEGRPLSNTLSSSLPTSAVFGFIGAVGLAAIVFADFTPKLREVAKIDVTQATIAFAFIVPVTILQTLYVIIGFIGICRLHLTSLYIYTAIVFLDTVLHFSLILVSPFSGFLIATFLAQVAFLFMMCYLIEELKRANGIE